jgi:hypothetical protein
MGDMVGIARIRVVYEAHTRGIRPLFAVSGDCRAIQRMCAFFSLERGRERREGGREEGREEGRKGGREGGREERRKGGKEGGRNERREGGGGLLAGRAVLRHCSTT